jgi:hypothetical protein
VYTSPLLVENFERI